MRVKAYKGKVYGAELTAKEKKAMNLEISRQIAEAERKHANDLDILILYVLHVHLGFGKTRLRRFYEAFSAEHDALIAHYEMPEDNVWLADQMLKRIGVDVAVWNEELEKAKSS